jgi:hypothetical protein
MNGAADFFVRQKLERFAGDCRSAVQRLERAESLRDVKQWGEVHPGSIVAGLSHLVPERRQLEAAQERRATQIVEAQLAKLQAFAEKRDVPAFEKLRDECRAIHWPFLRGEQPRLLNRIDRELAMLERQLAGGDVARPRPRP